MAVRTAPRPLSHPRPTFHSVTNLTKKDIYTPPTPTLLDRLPALVAPATNPRRAEDAAPPLSVRIPNSAFRTPHSRLLFLQHIPHAPNRVQQLLLELRVDLPPQEVHVDLQHVRLRLEVIAPDGFQQDAAGQRLL